LYKVGLTQT